jgi:isopenicillin-N epimerase
MLPSEFPILRNKVPISRRTLLAGAGAAWTLRDDTIGTLSRLLRSGVDFDEKFWTELRSKFDTNDEFIQFNNAGLSPSPQVVQDAFRLESKRANENPSMVVYRRQPQEVLAIRGRLAELIDCPSTSLALTPNATYGLHTGILGLSLEAGRTCMVTDHEYPRARAAALQREKREGIKFVELEVGSTISSLPAQIPDNVGVGVFSSLTYVNGTILPISLLCNKVRSNGGHSLVDGAQAIGIIPQSVKEMGCDMYTACLHKWIMAPVGTGMFYVNSDLIQSLWPLHPAEPGSESHIDKFEHYGTRSFAPLLAVNQALDFHELIGLKNKLNRIRQLRRHLYEKLTEIPEIVVFGSLDHHESDILLNVGLKGKSGSTISQRLLSNYRIHTTSVSKGIVDGVRISPTIFTSIKECNLLISVLAEIAKA